MRVPSHKATQASCHGAPNEADDYEPVAISRNTTRPESTEGKDSLDQGTSIMSFWKGGNS